MKIYGLLTGRGNNTLKDKNILDVLGHPVLYYPACAALNSKYITKLFCSSDDEKILYEAEKLGHEPICRPAELALPTSQHVDCILHGMKVMEERGVGLPDILVVTLANNVTVKSEWIDACVAMMEADMTISAVVPVYQDNDHHPLRAKTVDGNNRLQMYEKGITGKVSTNRQDLPPCYFLSHNFWVLNVKQLLSGQEGQQPWGFMGNNIAYYEIDESIDIHKEIDLVIAKDWISRNYTDSVPEK